LAIGAKGQSAVPKAALQTPYSFAFVVIERLSPTCVKQQDKSFNVAPVGAHNLAQLEYGFFGAFGVTAGSEQSSPVMNSCAFLYPAQIASHFIELY
jgi:hypothetical protein